MLKMFNLLDGGNAHKAKFKLNGDWKVHKMMQRVKHLNDAKNE
jgi:hypothetical protein